MGNKNCVTRNTFNNDELTPIVKGLLFG
jgi:hypothetical protein